MTPMIWLMAAVIFLVIEIITPGLFFFGCLAVGAMAAALSCWLGAGVWWNWVVFFSTSTLLVLIVAPLVRRYMKRLPTEPVGLDRLIGQRAYVVEALDPATGKGQVRLEGGALWRAVSVAAIPVDSWVEVVEVTGTRLRVSPVFSERK